MLKFGDMGFPWLDYIGMPTKYNLTSEASSMLCVLT